MELGKQIQNQRRHLEWSQEYLAEKLGVSRPTISNWESNRTLPDVSNMLKLSVLFGCSIDELLKEDKVMTTKTFKTMTYNNKITPLRLDTGKSVWTSKGVEVKANVNMETDEVKFFVEKEDLEKKK